MEGKLEDKFNFYDFVGYVIPGGLVLLLIYWFCIGFLNLVWPFDLSSLGESVVLLAASYFLGHLVQAFGNDIERRQVRKWGGWFSEQLMRPNDVYFTGEFKASVRKCAEQAFGLSYELAGADDQVQESRCQEIFRLCYALLVQEGAAKHTEVFNSIYSFYRGLLAAVWLGVFVSATIIVKQLIERSFSMTGAALSVIGLPGDRFWHYDELQLFLGVVMLVFFASSIRPIASRFKRFGQHFAASVYRSFFVWSKTKQGKC